MSVTMAKADGVTVFTLTADPQSPFPPLCQVLKGLCYSPVCCSVSQHLRRVQRSSQSVLGTLHIMVGILSIGLAAILRSASAWWQMDDSLFPFWFGGMFILFGTVSILSEKYPSPCLVIFNVILNVAGVAFAIAAIVLYSLNLANMWLYRMCRNNDYYSSDDSYYSERIIPTESVQEHVMQEKCWASKAMALMLLRSISAVLIVLSVLQLCVTISSAVLGIKALRSSENSENKSNDDPELCKPLLEEVTSNPKA